MKKFMMIMTALLAACGKENQPLTLASRVEQTATRTAWSGGEHVQVSVNGADAVPFTVSPDGTLTPVTTLYWWSAAETLSARAWYPAQWIFRTDQSGGFETVDFLFAPTVNGITFRNAAATPLTFGHALAKVTVNLTAGEGVASLDGVSINLAGYTSGAPDTSDGAITGFGDGWITPREVEPDHYTALLVPRKIEGAQFIKITLNGFDYFYHPAAGDADLHAGCSYTYNITLQKTRLDVEVAPGGADWQQGSDHNVVADII